MTIIRTAGVLALALATAAPALAADSYGNTDDVTAVRVSRAAITPATAGEARQSLARLSDAAMEACGASSFSLKDHQQAVRRSACFGESMGAAVALVDNPYLTAAFQHRAGTVDVASAAGAGDRAGQ